MEILATPEFAHDWPEWARWLIGDPLAIVVIFVAALLALAIADVVIKRVVKRAAQLKPGLAQRGTDPQYAQARREARAKTLGSVAHSTVKFVVWLLAVALILEHLGVSMGLIVTAIGVVGVGVGLGAQSMVKDIIAGIFMIVEDQYGIGDHIDTDNAKGQVVSMSLRVTTLQGDDGCVWYVPNGTITRVGNKSQAEQASN
jgi:small conductance mechanosensitive channel